jgi:2-polyprenyl-3-methyl-5-hydroxy-6-metoxy-1,4-benzoquinol methylase
MSNHETPNPWDMLSHEFDTSRGLDQLPQEAADNVLIAWPPIVQFIKEQVVRSANIAVDVGCGAGAFAKKLSEMGFTVYGIDTSQEMIRVAGRNSSPTLQYIYGDSLVLQNMDPKADVVSSVMALQFIQDVRPVIKDMASATATKGIIVVAVFNPEYVMKHKECTCHFEGFEDGQSKTGFMHMGGQRVPVSVRTAKEYNALFAEHGFTNILTLVPPFTPEFLATYPMSSPDAVPDHLILGYKRT